MADKGSLKDAIYQAVIMQAEGKTAESEAALRRVLAEAPDEPDALHFLGLAEFRKGRAEDAARLISRAVAIKPDAAEFHFHLAETLRPRGKNAEAEAAYRRALEIEPKLAGAGNGLGIVLEEQGR
ncbi:MAG: tetratricopeptide repeat protein, partial [Rhodospirillales bacterium]|nr:tetratricopeptide repeat protein [Rhodospirillales bacterium]